MGTARGRAPYEGHGGDDGAPRTSSAEAANDNAAGEGGFEAGPDAPLLDPLGAWRRALERRWPQGPGAAQSAGSLRAALRPLRRYLAAHAGRAALRSFASDPLRRADLRALGLEPTHRPPELCALDDDDALREAHALHEGLARTPARDEPWLERFVLHQLGAHPRPWLAGYYLALLRREAPASCAALRRTYALAALAHAVCEGGASAAAAEPALCEAALHRAPRARAAALAYLLAGYRAGQRSAPLRAVRALRERAEGDPALLVRLVARTLLAGDGLALPLEGPEGAVALTVQPGARARPASALLARSSHSLAHVHAALALGYGFAHDAPYVFVPEVDGAAAGDEGLLADPTRLLLGHPHGRPAGQVLLCDMALREGDALCYARAAQGSFATARERATPAPSALRLVVRAALATPPVGLALPALDGASLAHARAGAHGGGAARDAEPVLVLLFRTQVNGAVHHNAPRVFATLRAGAWLRLARERDNAFDERAVEVRTREGAKLGYVPRDRNHALALLLDAGERVGARLERVEGPERSPFLLIDVLARLR